MATKIVLLLLLPTWVSGACLEATPSLIEWQTCAFGSLEMYLNVSAYINNITGCYTCAFDCNTDCICTNNSIVGKALAAKDYCNASICNNMRVELAMNYIIGNYNAYEVTFLKAQNLLITLCGRIGGECCNGDCVTGIQIERPDLVCHQATTIDPAPMRHWVIAVTFIGALNYIFTVTPPVE